MTLRYSKSQTTSRLTVYHNIAIFIAKDLFVKGKVSIARGPISPSKVRVSLASTSLCTALRALCEIIYKKVVCGSLAVVPALSSVQEPI